MVISLTTDIKFAAFPMKNSQYGLAKGRPKELEVDFADDGNKGGVLLLLFFICISTDSRL
jgi:hypothetical protein